MAASPLSLKEIQLHLNVPQHVLIHLCERKVIRPEVLDGRGRGKFRLFSRKNLFEFAVALELRRYGLSIELTEIIVRLLGVFEATVKAHRKSFSLPDDLAEAKIPFELYLLEGQQLVFAVGTETYLSVPDALKSNGRRIDRIKVLPSDRRSFLCLNLVALARSVTT